MTIHMVFIAVKLLNHFPPKGGISDHSEPDVVAAIITQLSLKAGLKVWGKDAHKAVHSEMKQLHF
jgi:hypothetical protein